MMQIIKNLEDVVLFAKQLIEESVNFHPDDDFNDYVRENGEPTFNNEDANKRNKLMDQCFKVCKREGKDIYSIMGDVFLIETGLVKYIPLSTSPLQDEVAAIPGRHLKGARLLSYSEIKARFDSI